MLVAALSFDAIWISTIGSPAFIWFAQTSFFGVLLTFLAGILVPLTILTLYTRFRRQRLRVLGRHEVNHESPDPDEDADIDAHVENNESDDGDSDGSKRVRAFEGVTFSSIYRTLPPTPSESS